MENELRLKVGSEYGSNTGFAEAKIKITKSVSKEDYDTLGDALRTISDIVASYSEDK